MRDRSQSSHSAGGIIQIFISEKVMRRRESLIKSNQRKILCWTLFISQLGAKRRLQWGIGITVPIKPRSTTPEIILTAKLHKFHIIFKEDYLDKDDIVSRISSSV
jgi:hypothetical protein